jgi:dihydrolipoamide dehydrogenase
MAMGQAEGFVKIVTLEERTAGMGAVGPEASDLLAGATVAMEMGASAEDLALTVHAHPTLSEAVREASEHAIGRAVHIMNQPLRASSRRPAQPELSS